IGIVPEVESPPSFLTAREYLSYIGLIRDIEGIEGKMKDLIEFLDIGDFQDMIGKDMSKGTKQRLMLAAAFIHEPPLLFLDEPFIGLDPYHQKRVKEYLLNYLKEGGTIFMCTHILEIAEKMCTRIAIMDHGKIVATGTVDELTGEGETLDRAFLRYTREDQ
ncbi:MAG: ABC transporter ATP-binding protein, partial [Halobacteriota archaeon]|nr:ABC transporter ATP-binding protein [Halobacteriota archaeon]